MITLTPSAVELLANLHSRGFQLRTKDGKLLVSPLSQLSESDRQSLRTHRDALLDMVRDDRPLERAIRTLANEVLDDATTLADFAVNMGHELYRGQLLQLLHRLADIGRRIHKTTELLCRDNDLNREVR
jgi:hypothetical protein